MTIKFISTFRGSYFLETTPKETAEIVIDYASNSNIIASKRKLDLDKGEVAKAINRIRIPDVSASISEAYAIEGTFQRNPAQEVAMNLGHQSHLIAVILGYQSEGDISKKDMSEIIPFTLNVRDEDTGGYTSD